MAEFDRIRWRCRRGLLELDLILQSFLERRFGALDADGRQRFSELLDEPDNDLLDLAMGRRDAPPRYQDVVEMLRGA
jgi:antitoxin CptB